MKIYTVHRPSIIPRDKLDQASGYIFVKEGFSWLGFLIPLGFLLYNKLWVEFFVFFGGLILLQAILIGIGLNEQIVAYCMLFVNLIFGFEANNIRRWNLDRSDYTLAGAVSGRNLQDCELKFFSSWSPSQYDDLNRSNLFPST